MEINYIYGKKNGIKKSYNCNGHLLQELNYLDDKLHGICKIYNPWIDNTEKIINYCNGQKIKN